MQGKEDLIRLSAVALLTKMLTMFTANLYLPDITLMQHLRVSSDWEFAAPPLPPWPAVAHKCGSPAYHACGDTYSLKGVDFQKVRLHGLVLERLC